MGDQPNHGAGLAHTRGVTDVSGVLRAERERAGLTLEEISDRTKIKVTLLQALERGDFDRLPGEFFTRAFLRTYARELRLSPDEVVAAYDARHGRVIPEKPEEQVAPVRSIDASDDRRLFLPSPRSAWPTIALAAAILVVISVMNRTDSRPPVDDVPVGTAGQAKAAEPAPVTPSVPKPPERLTIEIQPSRVMWVAGTADGKRVIYRLVEPGERVRLDAQNDFWFRVGDAGAFVYSINGSPSKPLGSPGEVREVTINRENYKALGQ